VVVDVVPTLLMFRPELHIGQYVEDGDYFDPYKLKFCKKALQRIAG
jgi:hypothetical protein